MPKHFDAPAYYADHILIDANNERARIAFSEAHREAPDAELEVFTRCVTVMSWNTLNQFHNMLTNLLVDSALKRAREGQEAAGEEAKADTAE